MSAPFWQTKTLAEMTREEWESLCDGCGRCCLVKLEDEDTDEVFFTDVACRLLDHKTCQCGQYTDRRNYVPDCIVLTPEVVAKIKWLPMTCGYRLVHEGEDLFPWHPLVSGDPNSVHRAGISVRGCVVSENEVSEEDLEFHVIHWVN
jgi:uncharacterized protein